MRKKETQKLLSQVKDTYNNIAQEFSNSRQFIGKEFALFKPYIKAGQNIVDIGCGNGRLLKFLHQEISGQKFSYVGVDNSVKLLEQAQKLFPEAKFMEGSMEHIPLQDLSYDVVFSLRAFHHLPTKKLRLQALEEMKRVLKSEGTLVLSVWNLWQKGHRKLFGRALLKSILSFGNYHPRDLFVPWNKREWRYYYAFTPNELKKLIEKSGFQIVEFFDRREEGKNSDFIIIAKKV